MTFFDTNAWIGEWPFQPLPTRDPAALRRHWRSHGIAEGFVSSFSSLWSVDPMPGNRSLRRALSAGRGPHPLPVLNLFGPGWQADLDDLLSWPEVRAIRLAPGYGGWRLRSAAARQAARAIDAAGRRVVLTARLVDERHEHPSLRVKPAKVKDILHWLGEGDVEPLIHGLTRWEVEELADQGATFATDLCFAEWEDTLSVLGRKLSWRKMMFGSLTPLHVTRAQVEKISASTQPARIRRAVADDNARRFFKL